MFHRDLDAHGLVAAIDDEFGAGDEGGCFRRGEHDGGTDEFLGVAEAGCRGVAEDVEDA